MNNQGLMFIQIVFAFFFIWWLWSRRGGGPKPTVLNLNQDLKIQKEIKEFEKHDNQQIPKSVSNPNSLSTSKSAVGASKEQRVKSLNVIFMWNGHSWDAYEVLGLPAGSPLNQVKLKFEELAKTSDEGQKSFLKLAYQSILEKSK